MKCISAKLTMLKTYFNFNVLSMISCKLVITPSSTKQPTTKKPIQNYTNPIWYYHFEGSMQYIIISHPNITFVINRVCQHMHSILNLHFQLLFRLLQYIQTKHFRLLIYQDKLHLMTYADSIQVSDLTDRKSTSDYYAFLDRTLIYLSNKK